MRPSSGKPCVNTAEEIAEVGQRLGVEADVEKVTDPATMMRYKVMSTPAVAIDGTLVHSGSFSASLIVISA